MFERSLTTEEKKTSLHKRSKGHTGEL